MKKCKDYYDQNANISDDDSFIVNETGDDYLESSEEIFKKLKKIT